MGWNVQTSDDIKPPVIPALELYMFLPHGCRSDGKTINCKRLRKRYQFEHVYPRVQAWKHLGWVDYYNDREELEYFEFEMHSDQTIPSQLVHEAPYMELFLLNEGYYQCHEIDGEWFALQQQLMGQASLVHGLTKEGSDGQYFFQDAQEALDSVNRFSQGETLEGFEGKPPGNWVRYKGKSGDFKNPLKP